MNFLPDTDDKLYNNNVILPPQGNPQSTNQSVLKKKKPTKQNIKIYWLAEFSVLL